MEQRGGSGGGGRGLVQELMRRVEALRAEKMTGRMPDAPNAAGQPHVLVLRERKGLQGHYGKVYALNWAGDSQHMVTAAQDGKMVIWNAWSGNKVHVVPLRTSWVMTCAFERQQNKLVVCAGLENVISVYQAGQNQPAAISRPAKELNGHDGYVSCCRFLDGENGETAVSSSGDTTCIVWDVERGEPRQHLTDHGGDVMAVASATPHAQLVASGSTDSTAKVWDIRSGECTHTFSGHTADINSIEFFPDGNAVGTGSDDSTCRLFDIRCCAEVNQFGNDRIICGITSVSFSKSGRILFAGYDDNRACGWDCLRGRGNPAIELTDHEARVSSVDVAPNGHAMATASWDFSVKIYA